MEYVFGVDTLKTIDSRHSELEGLQEVVREFPGETVVDRFVVTEKINSAEDPAGNCYDWYAIREHTRYVDRTPPLYQSRDEAEAALLDLDTTMDQRMTDIETALVELDAAQNGGM